MIRFNNKGGKKEREVPPCGSVDLAWEDPNHDNVCETGESQTSVDASRGQEIPTKTGYAGRSTMINI